MSDLQVSSIIDKLPPYQAKQKLVEKRQDTYDIIREILRKHDATKNHYDSISNDFWRGNAKDTAIVLFNFCKSNIGYVIESTLEQTVKSPAAILAEKQGDCKHYASFIVGICESLRRKGYPINSFYRFASYKKDKRNPGHVFAVVKTNQGELFVDPVLSNFNQRTPMYVYKLDKVPYYTGGKIGELYDISGIPNQGYVSGHISPLRKAGIMHWLDEMAHHKPHSSHLMHHRNFSKPGMYGRHQYQRHDMFPFAPMAPVMPFGMHGTDDIGKFSLRHLHIGDKLKHIKIRPFGKKIKIRPFGKSIDVHGFLKKIQPGRLLMKFVGAVPRNAFLGLVKKNVFQMAVRMYAGKKANSSAYHSLIKKWEDMGGNGNKLNTAIDQGIKNYNKHHSKKITGLQPEYENIFDGSHMGNSEPDMGVYNGIGVAVIDDAVGLLAAAAPILAALKGILKALGVDKNKMESDTDQAQNDLVDNHNNGTDNGDGTVTHDDGTVTSAHIDPVTNQQVVTVHKAARSAVDEGSSIDDGSTDDGGSVDDGSSALPVKPNTQNMLSTVKQFIVDHKTYFIIGGVAVMAIIFVPRIFPHKRRR